MMKNVFSQKSVVIEGELSPSTKTTKLSKILAGSILLICTSSAYSSETIDFEGIAPGTIVDTVFSAGGIGPIGVLGNNPELDLLFNGPNNAAVIFDSSNPPGTDFDIATPNETFAGPGIGEDGEAGSPFENDTAQGHILIINEADLFVDRDLNGEINNADSPVSLTNDADNENEPLVFDFSALGSVTIEAITLIDVEGSEDPATVELQDGSGAQLAMFSLPQTGDNGLAKAVSLGSTHNVVKMIVILNGSGAIDDIVFTVSPTASLGDRVWEDKDGDGIQDCSDTNADQIIGNAGDTGAECDAGIPNIEVKLLAGDCQTPLGQTAMTDLNGFYLFSDLDPEDYCVEFGKPPVDFCNTDGFDLGAPQFTKQNIDDDALDSDANSDTGVTDSVNLIAGKNNRTLDAGIFCPAKLGDRVWFDDNEDGIQDDDEDNVEGVKVTLYECGDDMIAGTDDDVNTGEMRTTDADGMYMFGAEAEFTLNPGKYFVQFMKPNGTVFTTPNANGDAVNSDCLAPEGITSCTTLGPRDVNLSRDCGLIPPPPPECDLVLDKACLVEAMISSDLECKAKIAASQLVYTGAGTPTEVTVSINTKGSKAKKSSKAKKGKKGSKNGKANNIAELSSSYDASTGILTISALPGDLGARLTITTNGVIEELHTSCSVPYVAGQPAPLNSPKGAPSSNWSVLNFTDKEGTSVSASNEVSEGIYADNCTIAPQQAPSCAVLKESGEKVTSLTFEYTGGGCDGNNDQGDKSSCSGTINTGESVNLFAGESEGDLSYAINPVVVMPNEEFTINPSKFGANTALVANNVGGEEVNNFHTSCSRPLEIGDEFGSFTLRAINNQRGASGVTYKYTVTNNGAPLTNIMITDDLLGDIGIVAALGMGDTDDSLAKTVGISTTTINHATAIGILADGTQCPAYDSVTVTVTEPKPPVDDSSSECDGKVTNLTLKNLGPDAQVRVDQKKAGTAFDEFVPTGGKFSFSGTDDKNTLGTEISIYVNGSLNTKIHTSCSNPIGPGLVGGDFEVISGDSRNGGALPPI